MTLCFIYARSENRCIGKNGRVPWQLPDEFAHFQRTTLGKPIIMGRRTYEDHESLLPGRLNLVVTTRRDYPVAAGVEVCPSLEAALERARQDGDEVFIVGGVTLFRAAFSEVSRIYETVVHTQVEDGDTFVPEFDLSNFDTTTLFQHAADARNAFSFTVVCHDRRS
jgi:dihydrofolate reductase